MTHSPGLFHVYFVGIGDSSAIYTLNSPLYLVTFSSRSEADNWWRAAKLSSHNGSALRRFSPQFIMAPLPNIQDGWKCFIQTLKDNFNPRKALAAASDPRPDHFNGEEYYIRSATTPHRYWFLREEYLSALDIIPDSKPYSTDTSPTRFIIKRTNELPYECRDDEDILISEDDVEIFVAPIWLGELPMQLVMTPLSFPSDRGIVEASRVTTVAGVPSHFRKMELRSSFKFGWFEKGFYISNSASQQRKDVSVAPGKGQRWELVR